MPSKITIIKCSWTVIFHYGRGSSTILTGLTRDNAQRMVDIAVFHNEDCVNFKYLKFTNNKNLGSPAIPSGIKGEPF